MATINIPRTKFKFKPINHPFTCDHGDLIPVYATEVIAGDSWKIDLGALIQLATPAVPFMGDIEVNFNAFFVPFREIDYTFKEFFGEMAEGSVTPHDFDTEIAQISLYESGVPAGSVAHHLGFPICSPDVNQSNYIYGRVNPHKLRAYYKIWSDYYRHEQIQPGIITRGNYNGWSAKNNSSPTSKRIQYQDQNFIALIGSTAKTTADMPLKVCKKYDYFTSGTISPVYSGDVKLPLGNAADVKLKATNIDVPLFRKNVTGQALAGTGDIVSYSGSKLALDENGPEPTPVLLDPNSTLYADLTTASAATISALKYALSVESYLYKSNFGTRYYEGLTLHYGTKSPDLEQDRPQFLGHMRKMLNVNSVVSQSTTTGSDLGEVGAVSRTAFTGNLFNAAFSEPGILMILMDTKLVGVNYCQGITKEDTKKNRFEFYSPEFAGLYDDKILKKELYLSKSSSDEQVFNYNAHWEEYRRGRNIVSGQFDPTVSGGLGQWALTKTFSAVPSFNSNFILEEPDILRSSLLVTTGTVPDYLCRVVISPTVIRELPAFSAPELRAGKLGL